LGLAPNISHLLCLHQLGCISIGEGQANCNSTNKNKNKNKNKKKWTGHKAKRATYGSTRPSWIQPVRRLVVAPADSGGFRRIRGTATGWIWLARAGGSVGWPLYPFYSKSRSITPLHSLNIAPAPNREPESTVTSLGRPHRETSQPCSSNSGSTQQCSIAGTMQIAPLKLTGTSAKELAASGWNWLVLAGV